MKIVSSSMLPLFLTIFGDNRNMDPMGLASLRAIFEFKRPFFVFAHASSSSFHLLLPRLHPLVDCTFLLGR